MKWLNVCIVFTLLFGGGLCLALEMVMVSITLFVIGIAVAIFLNNRNLLPE